MSLDQMQRHCFKIRGTTFHSSNQQLVKQYIFSVYVVIARTVLDGLGDKRYDFIVADIRWKDAAEDIRTFAGSLEDGGTLVLGSVDDVDEDSSSKSHCGSMLRSFFSRIPQTQHEACFPHIYKETRNKHQFTISYLSVWRKNPAGPGSGSDVTSTKSDSKAKDAVEYYECSGILNSYDIFHFGEGLLSVKNFPLRMSEVCVEACKKYATNLNTALDAGSGPGRTAMELSKVFKQVKS